MATLRFVWDPGKARENFLKHGITFEDAATAFHDENAKMFEDPEHSQMEDRFLLLGLSYRLRALVVCHCHRQSGSSIRIISARKATRREQEMYWR